MRNGEWANQTLNSLFLIAQALPRGKSWSLLSHLCLSSLNTKHYLSWAFLFSLTSSREEQIANNIGSQSPRRSPLKARKSKDLWPFFFLSTSLEGQLKQSYLYILTWYKLSLRKRKVVCVGLYPITEKYYLSSVLCNVSWHSAPFRPSFPHSLPPSLPSPPPSPLCSCLLSFLPCFWWRDFHDCPWIEVNKDPRGIWAGLHGAAFLCIRGLSSTLTLVHKDNSALINTVTTENISVSFLIWTIACLWGWSSTFLGSKRRKETLWKFPWYFFSRAVNQMEWN